jgi:Helix-turn-helix domain
MHMAGRHPAGPEYVEQLEGSDQAKRRLRIVLETLAGTRGIGEAAELLGITEQRVHQLREEALQAALAELEPKPAGRPRRAAPSEDPTVLRDQLLELEKELRAAKVRESIALVFPELVVKRENQTAAEPEKKTTARPKRRARPGWWKK